MKARRTRSGEVDPYAELRDESEAELFDRVRRAFRAGLSRTMAALGDEPDMARLDYAYQQAERGALTAAILPVLERNALGATVVQTEGAKAAPLVLPVTWDEAVIASAATAWAARYVGELVREITDHTMGLIRRAVANWIDTPGLTIGDLRRTLEPAFGEMRAQRIAVTETTRAFAEGQKLVQADLARGGLGLVREWRTSMDERVCLICGALEDRRETDGWDGYDGPPSHPGCRCWTVLAL